MEAFEGRRLPIKNPGVIPERREDGAKFHGRDRPTPSFQSLAAASDCWLFSEPVGRIDLINKKRTRKRKLGSIRAIEASTVARPPAEAHLRAASELQFGGLIKY